MELMERGWEGKGLQDLTTGDAQGVAQLFGRAVERETGSAVALKNLTANLAHLGFVIFDIHTFQCNHFFLPLVHRHVCDVQSIRLHGSHRDIFLPQWTTR
jgi:hypothetical protein